MEVDVVIRHGKIVTTDSVLEAGIAIDKGKFVAIAKGQELPDARKVIDATRNFILPGVVDEHVHMQDE